MADLNLIGWFVLAGGRLVFQVVGLFLLVAALCVQWLAYFRWWPPCVFGGWLVLSGGRLVYPASAL